MITGNVLPALIAYVHSTSLITGYNTFNMNITQWAYIQGSGESWGVMPRVSQVVFSAWGHSGVKPRSHTNTQQRREQRDACFLAGNTVNILSLCQLNMRILRFIVHSVLAVLFKGVISNQITFSRYVSIRDNKTCQHSYKQMSLTDKNTIIHEKYILVFTWAELWWSVRCKYVCIWTAAIVQVCLMAQISSLGFPFCAGIRWKHRPGLSPRLLVHPLAQQLSSILAEWNRFQTKCLTCFLCWWAAENAVLLSTGHSPGSIMWQEN